MTLEAELEPARPLSVALPRTGGLQAAAVGLPAWLTPLLVALAAALFWLPALTHPPHPDELYTTLAAQGLLAAGEPRIADGLYTRAALFTRLVALSLSVFGESLWAARLPALLPMAATVGLLFAWLRAMAGNRAAWIGAGLFAVSPFAVDIATFARFYGLQTLAFLSAALLLERAVASTGGLPARLAAGLGAVLALLVATYLQPTTLIGATGLGLWLVLRLGVPWLLDPAVPAARKTMLVTAILSLGLAVVLGAWLSGVLEAAWALYESTPLFNQPTQDAPWFYQQWFLLYYPSLWPLMPFLALLALARRPRPALLAACVFATAFLLHSFAASKGLRYIVYAQPFLFILLGIALAACWDGLRRGLAGLHGQLAAVLPLGAGAARRLTTAFLVLAGLWLLIANPAAVRSLALLAQRPLPGENPPIRWSQAEPALRPWLGPDTLVITMAELETLYFLGDYDVLMSRSRRGELDEDIDFARDPRTGRPVIGSLEALNRLIDCAPRGIYLSNRNRWGQTTQMPEGATDLLQRRARPLELPAPSRVIAYVWEHPATAGACDGLPTLEGRGS